MTVKKLIKKLNKFSKKYKNGENMEVHITDGNQQLCYHGEFEIKKFKDTKEDPICDIGIGGMRE